jgi:hypothetical protein
LLLLFWLSSRRDLLLQLPLPLLLLFWLSSRRDLLLPLPLLVLRRHPQALPGPRQAFFRLLGHEGAGPPYSNH